MSVDENGNIRGAMSMFVYPERLFGLSLLYAPRGPVCAAGDTAAMRDLFNGAEQIARKHRAVKLVLDPDITEEDNEFLKTSAFSGKTRGQPKDNTICSRFRFSESTLKQNATSLWRCFTQRRDTTCARHKRRGMRNRSAGRPPRVSLALARNRGKRRVYRKKPGYFEKMYDVWRPTI